MRYQFSRDDGAVDDRPLLSDRAFNRHSKQDGDHVSPFDRSQVDVGVDKIEVRLIQGIEEESFQRVAGMAVRATIGIDPEAPPEDMPWEEMLKGGLQTALETQTVVFGVSGVSRTCTHQLVRSRRAAFHQQSQRASYMGNQPDVRMPESVWKDEEARELFLEAVRASHIAYQAAMRADISYQDARFILPEGTETYILCEYPLRTFIETYAYRGCVMFQWEIVHVMREMRRLLVEAHPWLDPYIKISCERTGPAYLANVDGTRTFLATHQCTFQGWESVDEQCDFPWGRDETRTYKPDPALRIGK